MISRLFRSRKGAVTERLGEEIVDEILEAGLAILLVVAGISYFNLEENWVEAVTLFAENAGLQGVQSEISMMYNSVVSGFPFSFISAHLAGSIAFGAILCIAGITIKIITLKSREEFIRDMGKVILVPGILGVIAIVFIQIMTVNSLNDLFTTSDVGTAEIALGQISSGAMLWNMMGLLFLIGFFSLIFGAMLLYMVKALKGKPAFLAILSRFLVFIGWFGLGYYLIVRLLALEAISGSLYGGNILKLFAFSWYISRGTFMTAVIMFALGFTLYKHGNKEIRKKRRAAIREAKRNEMVIHKSPYEQG
ncbi:MAG: hypothetical protein R6U32_04630 [Candidatus Woesearchaeota archaeon]